MSEQKRPASWGGARTGAGRPAATEELERLEVKVRPDQLAWLDRAQAVAGEKSRAETVRRLLDEARRVAGLREALAGVVAGQYIDDGEPVLAQWVLDVLDGKADPAEESTPGT